MSDTGHTPIQIANRRELFVDDYLVDRLSTGASLNLQKPVKREVVMSLDRPWEGSMSTFITVFQDDDRYRMYYTAWDIDLDRSTGDDGLGLVTQHDMWICTAESKDGLRWERPELGLIEHEGSTINNILWTGAGPRQNGSHGFAPFKDSNPSADPKHLYKAVGGERFATRGHLYVMGSPDGIQWSMIQDEPVLFHKTHGNFDSQNLAFWDSTIERYRVYFRKPGPAGRDIGTATSEDFVNWTDPELLQYPGAPGEELYTNQVIPYYRAPHILLGFPSRYVHRDWSPSIEALPEPDHRRLRSDVNTRFGTALTDGLFMSSRDGITFNRWGEAFLRPGPQLKHNWAYGDNYQCWGMFETPSPIDHEPAELSFFAREGVWRGPLNIRRYSLRVDGFVSLNAPRSGAEMITKPLVFDGNRMKLNFSTSAAGGIFVEIQDANGTPLPGFSLADSHETIGDELDRAISWKNSPDPGSFSGKPVRLKFVFNDADIFSLRFTRE